MSHLKFELFITLDDQQTTHELGDSPILFGCADNCHIKMGDGEPKIKALVQKEEGHLLVKIFDTNYPIQIGEKKFKSAKLKKSVFFKIGHTDIILNVEEIREIKEVIPEIEDSFELPDYDDVEEEEVQTSEVDRGEVAVASAVPSISSLPAQPDGITSTFNLAEHNLAEHNLEKKEPVQDVVENIIPESKVTENLPVDTLGLSNSITDDGFNFSIVFNENNYVKKNLHSYAEKNMDFTDYIDPKDETVIELPTPEIHTENDSECIHMIHMNNGTVLNERFFSINEKRVFVSSTKDRKNCMKIHDCNFDKFEIVFNRDGKTSVVALDGYELQKVSDDELIEVNHKTVHLNKSERMVLSKGTSQIIIEIKKTPPGIKHNRFFNTDESLLKSLSVSWAFALLMLAVVLIFPPQKEEKVKKQIIVVYKRKKIKKQVKKPDPPSQEVAKSDTKKALPKKEISKPAPAPKKVVVKKTPPKPVKKMTKKVTKVKPAKRPVKKVAKAKPVKVKRKARKVTRAKAPAPTPKKQYKFNFGSKMSAAASATSNTHLKSAKNSKNVNMASSMNSASSVTSKFDSKGFGVSKSKVARFAAGGPSGKSSAIGTRGLSGKTKSTTAYIEANTKILGAMDPELIRKIMREFIPEFRHCYQRELVHNSSVAGVFDLAFQINARGKGVKVGVISKGKGFSKRGVGCLKRVVKLIKFPRPKGGGMVDVKQPMNFYKQ